MSALALATLDLSEYAAGLNARLRSRPTLDVLRTAIRELFPGEIALVSSFGAESAVLLHLVAQVDPATPVLFLDTGKLFSETLSYRDELAARLGLSQVRVLTPDPKTLAANDAGGTLWFRDADACCRIRKVEPLQRGLKPYAAWINGRKQFQAATRRDLPLVESDGVRIKFNPLAQWTPEMIAAYFAAHDLPRHPLVAKGYLSIGCEPCTLPVAEDEDARAGRWQGQDKTECGIHTVIAPFPTRTRADD
ncbi:MAG TPA: phosphoadenylyl-sulfate reductase [Ferrovibrio sp.]|uniref:phosphoadenylyl-sulfate reductase n=1 Tax=Ferrovibrio sp. TaxID=1917215 RepID=UPI002B4B8994|nr:phosphoadenylyl-sulfate reductase [Ferrovibrio sp.]HLT79127.1 phosphoadenylyl-sulfate reductase [Ferrovibrio sp.]